MALSYLSRLLCLITVCLTSDAACSRQDLSAEETTTGLLFKLEHIFHYDMVPHKIPAQALDIRDQGELSDLQPFASVPTEFTLHGLPTSVDTTSTVSSLNDVQFDEQVTLQVSEPYAKFLPNTSDKETVVNLAKMTSDSYLFDPREPGWLNTSLGYNFTSRFGWNESGIRGHVFTTADYGNVVVSFKGTTIDPRDKLSSRDRFNDNTLFSCCCGAYNPYGYGPVCNCTTGQYQCDSTCLTSALLQNDTYYDAAMFIVSEFRGRYPEARFWLVGHSLGGSLASLVGLTLDIPSVSYEAPPERLPAERMGLLMPVMTRSSKRTTAYHFGHTADPIYVGSCNGLFSLCSFWGFSFDSRCHSGRRCAYDTVKDKGWRVSINNHRINYVIENVLKAYDDVPECVEDLDCHDCLDWTFS